MRAPTSLVGDDRLEIRSFRVVFALERRLFRIDRWRLPLPYGLPVRGIGYAAAALLSVLIAGALPGLGVVVAAVPAPVRLVIGPAAMAALLARVRIDGRPAHRCALAWARHRLGPRTLDAFSRVPARGTTHVMSEAVVLAVNSSDSHYRPAEVRGPAVVSLGLPATARQRRRRLEITAADGPPLRRRREVTLAAGQRLVVRGTP